MLEVGKDVTWIIHYDEVHPWTQEKGWDTMEVFASTEEHLTAAIELAVLEKWLLYTRDTTGKKAAFLCRRMKMNDEWKVFQRGHRYQIGRYYFGLFHVQKIEWYMERQSNYSKNEYWETSSKELAVSFAKQINDELFNREARSKAFAADHWKEVT